MPPYRSDYENSDEMYRLRWDSSKQVVDLSNSFNSFRNDDELLDVSLVCSNNKGGSVTLRAHKLILAAYSPVFKDMFKNMNDKKDPAIFLKGISHDNLASMLDFMYQGSVDIPKSVLNDFIADAEELQIKGLRGENDDDYRSEKERNDFARTAKTNPKASRLGLDQDPWSNMGLDKTKRSNKPMKRELEDKPASNDFLSNDLSEFESLIKDSDTNNLKRAKRPPKKKAKTEPLDDDAPFTADIKPKVASHKSHNLSSMDSEEKAQLESMFEKLDKWGGSDTRKRALYQCKQCSWEGRSDKRAQHMRANHSANH